MRDLPEELVARIESGAASLCHVWILTRADGMRRGFTDHDRDLRFEGLTCKASSAWTAGAADGGLGAPGQVAVGGGVDDGGLAEEDILAGLWDQAICEGWRVDWLRPDLRVRLWRGRLAKIRREGEAFVADFEGPLAALERVVGRTYGRACDAVLGDARCSVDLADHPGAVCDKSWAACTQTFGNGINFQGFPDIPGDDFLTAYPVEGGRHDGRSRR